MLYLYKIEPFSRVYVSAYLIYVKIMLGFEMTDRRPILEGPDTTSNDRRLALERSADALLEAHAAAKAIGDTVLLSLISSALLHVGKQLAKAVIQPFKP